MIVVKEYLADYRKKLNVTNRNMKKQANVTIGNVVGIFLSRVKTVSYAEKLTAGEKLREQVGFCVLRPWKIPSFSFLPQALPTYFQNCSDLLFSIVILKNLN